MTYKALYEHGKNILPGDEAGNETLIILEHLMGTDRSDLFLNPDREIEESVKVKFDEMIERRLTGEPVQYITGTAYFYGLELYTDSQVLIPRFDTEVLVEETLKVMKAGDSILDVCTGSGCILAALLSNNKDINADGIDISDNALALAQRNLNKYGLKANIYKSDLFENVSKKYDIIVSNPPYIETEIIDVLEKQVKMFEPHLALDGGKDGLDFYRIISKEAKAHLYKNGKILYEIGYDQGEDVPKILAEEGFENIKVIKDLSGNDRVVTACLGG